MHFKLFCALYNDNFVHLRVLKMIVGVIMCHSVGSVGKMS